jgi:molybdopterin molybdotransferase
LNGGPITLADARAAVTGHVALLGNEQVAIGDARGRVLAEDLVSPVSLPPFDNSAMDGFAMRAEDTAGATGDSPVRLRLVGESRAGGPAETALEPGSAMRISTGAMMPAGADAVLRVEQSEIEGVHLLVARELPSGNDVRPSGDDVAEGSTVLEAGCRLGAGELALAAGVGVGELTVSRLPRVNIVATGDELTAPGEPLAPGHIYDSNSQMLRQLAEIHGGRIGDVRVRVEDSPQAVQQAVAQALEGADVLVLCGGVSMGEHDHVKPTLREAGADEVFWQVALRPGHPAWFGVRQLPDGGQTLIFGLPGNPVSAYVTFLLLVAPALRRMQGLLREPLHAHARYEGPTIRKRPGFAQVLRCRLTDSDGELVAELTAANQRSHALSSLAGADALLFADPAAAELRAGDKVETELLGQYT